jgi:hypothetical protein
MKSLFVELYVQVNKLLPTPVLVISVLILKVADGATCKSPTCNLIAIPDGNAGDDPALYTVKLTLIPVATVIGAGVILADDTAISACDFAQKPVSKIMMMNAILFILYG